MATADGPGSLPSLPHTTAAPNSQTPGHPSFRRWGWEAQVLELQLYLPIAMKVEADGTHE